MLLILIIFLMQIFNLPLFSSGHESKQSYRAVVVVWIMYKSKERKIVLRLNAWLYNLHFCFKFKQIDKKLPSVEKYSEGRRLQNVFKFYIFINLLEKYPSKYDGVIYVWIDTSSECQEVEWGLFAKRGGTPRPTCENYMNSF